MPRSAIVAEAGRLGMGPDEAEWFAALIAAMDEGYFAFQRERREAAENADKVELSDAAGVKRLLTKKVRTGD